MAWRSPTDRMAEFNAINAKLRAKYDDLAKVDKVSPVPVDRTIVHCRSRWSHRTICRVAMKTDPKLADVGGQITCETCRDELAKIRHEIESAP